MQLNKVMEDFKISLEDMKMALSKSGYLIESRLIKQLSGKSYTLFPNETYPDPKTEKSREIDVYANSEKTRKTLHRNERFNIEISHSLVIECINNPTPVIVFKDMNKKPFTIFEKFKYNKIELKTLEESSGIDFDFNDFTICNKEFHYNQLKRNTQYCSFSQKKGGKNQEWMASHEEKLHDTFNKLFDFVNHHFERKREKFLYAPQRMVTFDYLFPVIVFQGEMYEAYEDTDDVQIEKIDHAIFEFNRYENESSSLLVDIVTEKYFPKYLSILENDMKITAEFYETYYSDKSVEFRDAITKVVF
ncbi:MAG: hypothetical protein PHR83_18885 [Paludibacter sp.]|nr:hypothetical protein [Paludibacter sp.]